MVKARVTSKGQVTLPAELRRQLGVEPGDDLDFVMEDRGVYITVVKRAKLSELHGILRLPKGAKMPTKKEAREAARRAAVERHERIVRDA